MFNIANDYSGNDDTIEETQLDDLIDAAGIYGADVRTEYSGRGMYGKSCPGITLEDDSDLLALAAAAGQLWGPNGIDFVRSARTDSMGTGIIVYWPGATIGGEDGDED